MTTTIHANSLKNIKLIDRILIAGNYSFHEKEVPSGDISPLLEFSPTSYRPSCWRKLQQRHKDELLKSVISDLTTLQRFSRFDNFVAVRRFAKLSNLEFQNQIVFKTCSSFLLIRLQFILPPITNNFAYMVKGIIPLFSYFFVSKTQTGLLYSVVLTLITLFVFGYLKSKVTGYNPIFGAFKVALIGAVAAGAAFFVARLFG